MQYFGVAQVPATLGLSLFVVGYGYVKPLTRNHAARIDDPAQTKQSRPAIPLASHR